MAGSCYALTFLPKVGEPFVFTSHSLAHSDTLKREGDVVTAVINEPTHDFVIDWRLIFICRWSLVRSFATPATRFGDSVPIRAAPSKWFPQSKRHTCGGCVIITVSPCHLWMLEWVSIRVGSSRVLTILQITFARDVLGFVPSDDAYFLGFLSAFLWNMKKNSKDPRFQPIGPWWLHRTAARLAD